MTRTGFLFLLFNILTQTALLGQSTNPFDVYRDEEVRYDSLGQMIHKVENLENPFDIDPTPYVTQGKNSSKATKTQISAPKIQLSNKWPLWCIVISLFILAITINLRRKTFTNMYRAIANDNYLKLLQREENNGNSFFFYLLYLIFVINAGLFIYLSISRIQEGVIPLTLLYIFGGILLIYAIRHLVLYVIGAIFPLRKEASLYSFLILILNSQVGILLLIVNAFLAFSPFSSLFMYIGLICLVGFYIWRTILGLFMMLGNQRMGIFHFFIYLCTCEIAPNLIIWKFVCNYLV